ISITTDHANLYDPSVGIYVNATQHGLAWERPASAELINPDGSKGFQINAGLRIRGGYSRNSFFKKHAFRLFFRSEYGEGKLRYPLFEDEGVKAFDKIDLRTAQNYSWTNPYDDRQKNTFLRDIVCRDASGAMGNAYTRSRYYHLYLNGQYWGLYMTEERPEAGYGESYLGGDSDDYDVIKVSGATDPWYQIEATDGNTDAYNRLFAAATNGFADNAAYFAVQGLDANGQPDPTKEKLLDLKNLIDYVLLIDYAGASDNCISQFGNNAGINNIYALYNRANPDGFKWVQHDCEHALDTSTSLDRTGPFTSEVFNMPQYFNAQTLHDRLSANAEYRLAFADRVYKHFENGGALVHTNMEALVDYRAEQIDRAILANAARWGSTSLDRDTWVNAVATTRAWFNGRAQTVIGYLDADGLIPSILPPQISRSGGLVTEGTTVSLSEAAVTEPPLSSPYYGTPMAIPGTVEAEDYDLGGPGIAYQDTDAGNNGGAYRISEGVDIESCSEGGYNVGYAAAGEWINYSVDATAEGDYIITCRVARGMDGEGAFHIEVNGANISGSIPVQNTGGWQAWTNKTANVTLDEGEQVVKLVVEAGGFNINHLDFTFIATNTVPAVTNFPTTIYYTTDGTDPRAIGGGIAGSVYSGAITITEPTHIKARVRNSIGEWSALAEATFWTPEIPLAVTELMYHAPVGNPHDYIEIKNISDHAVTLKGYKLDNAIDFKFKNGPVSLESGEYMVVVDDIDAFGSSYDTNGIIIAGEFSGDLSNGGEEVDLEFRDNDLISFSYSDARNWPQAADGAGHSLVPLEAAMNDQERGSLDYGGSWRASTYIGGSPGYADPVGGASVVLNEIIAHTDTGLSPPFDSNDKIELYNPTDSAVTLFGWHLSDDLESLTKFAIPNGTTVPAFGFIVFDEDDFHPGRTNGFGLNKAGEQVVLSAPGRVVDAIRFKGQENGVSLGRYPDGAVDWLTTLTTPGSANQPVAATVRISELMYNPLQPGDDYEYIQLENIGPVNHLFENSAGTYRIDGGVEFDFPPGMALAAGERLWIISFNPTNTAKLNLFCSAYGLNATNETFLGGYKGELSDRSGRVAL
ncbi:MAG TPA: lamin tail domain-containing protein, partial [Pontiella sp.]|nr:lamin tail domain-containing protein [Pontiella sp.]